MNNSIGKVKFAEIVRCLIQPHFFHLKSKHGTFYWNFTSCEVAASAKNRTENYNNRIYIFKGFRRRIRIQSTRAFSPSVFVVCADKQINNKKKQDGREKKMSIATGFYMQSARFHYLLASPYVFFLFSRSHFIASIGSAQNVFVVLGFCSCSSENRLIYA